MKSFIQWLEVKQWLSQKGDDDVESIIRQHPHLTTFQLNNKINRNVDISHHQGVQQINKVWNKIHSSEAGNTNFVNVIIQEFPDLSAASVYADWLEERGSVLAIIYRAIGSNQRIFTVRRPVGNPVKLNLQDLIQHMIEHHYVAGNENGMWYYTYGYGFQVLYDDSDNVRVYVYDKQLPRELHYIIKQIWLKRLPANLKASWAKQIPGLE